MSNPAHTATTTTATTTPTTIPVTLVLDFLFETADPADGEADALRSEAPVRVEVSVGSADFLDCSGELDEELAAVVVAMLEEELVDEIVVRDTVLEIMLPFGDRRTPVPLLQQSGELSQQNLPSGH